MSEKPDKPASREGKKSFQAFIPEPTLMRFRAACALAGVEQSETVDRLMSEYADRVGIPKTPLPPKPPRR